MVILKTAAKRRPTSRVALGRLFEKPLLIRSHSSVAIAPGPHRGAATVSVRSQKFTFRLIQKIISELRLLFPVGMVNRYILFIYVY